MKKETLNRWLSALVAAVIILPQLMSLIVKLTGLSSAAVSAAVYAAGFACVLFFIIVMLKSVLKIKENPAHIIIYVMAVLLIVSYYAVMININNTTTLSMTNANDLIKTMLLGEDGRYEGMLTLLAYMGIFLLATAIPSEKALLRAGDIFIGTGILQCFIAVLQHIPETNILTDYANLYTKALKNVMLSSGLEESPIFYGTYLTILFGAAFNGAIYSKSGRRALVYGIAAFGAVVTGLFTSSIVPIIGIGCGFAVSLIALLIKQSKGGVKFEGAKLKTAMMRFIVLTAVSAVGAVLVCVLQGIYIRDKLIAYEDAYYRLFVVSGYSPVNTDSLYEIAWGRSIEMIKGSPFFGIGADCFAKAQLMFSDMTENSIDKSYNEYLYIAVTQGLISLAAYIALLVCVIINCIKGLKLFAADSTKWYYAAFAAIIAAYIVQAMFSASTIAVSPLIWLVMGMTCAKKIEVKKN